MDDLIIVEALDFGVSALRGHSCISWYKSKGLVCLLVTLLPQPNLCWSSFVVMHLVTCKIPGVVLLPLQADLVWKLNLCVSVCCARPGLCLYCFSLSYSVTFFLVANGAGSHLRSCEHRRCPKRLIQSIYDSALILVFKQMAAEGTLGNACPWLWLQPLVRRTESLSEREVTENMVSNMICWESSWLLQREMLPHCPVLPACSM